MAAEKKNEQRSKDAAKPDQAEGAERPARHIPWTTVIVVAGVLLMEVGTVLVVMWLNRGPSAVEAQPIVQPDGAVVGGQDAEELIVEGKATNTKRGRTYVYRFQIYAVVSRADAPAVRAILEKRRATVEDAVRQVVARLDPKDLDQEPELVTVRRLLMGEFEQVFGPGKIKQLVIPEWTPFPADY